MVRFGKFCQVPLNTKDLIGQLARKWGWRRSKFPGAYYVPLPLYLHLGIALAVGRVRISASLVIVAMSVGKLYSVGFG